jgi:alcohol dehydrogenase
MPADASRTWVSTAGQSRNSGDRNISITMRLDAVTTPMLLKAEHSGWLQPNKLVTHRFANGRQNEGVGTRLETRRKRAL